MKTYLKYIETVKNNSENNYNDFINGYKLGDIIKNYILLMLFIIFLFIYLPNIGLISYIVLILSYVVAIVWFFRDLFRRRTIIGLGKKGFVIAIFGLNKNKYINFHEILFDNIRYISFGGYITKSINISFIDIDGRLKKYKIAVSRINKVLDSYYNITNKVLEMQKEFDRGDF